VGLARHRVRAATATCPIAKNVLARLREYVMEHLAERILVADLAMHAGFTPNRFAVSFREQTGQSPHQFVLALRLEHAAELLRHSSLRVADVAYACGFSNQQHLTNTMRRHLGTTPSRYRDLQRPEACS
jgi:AraC family transcriptional regulator